MSAELRECPFCGAEKGNPQVFTDTGGEGVFIHCITCGVSTDTFVDEESAKFAWTLREPMCEAEYCSEVWMVKCQDGSLIHAASKEHAEALVASKQPKGAVSAVRYLEYVTCRPAQAMPDGMVMVQIKDVERLCKYSKHSPTSAISARRVEALIDSSKAVQS